QMPQGLSGLQATGAALVRPYIFVMLAQAYREVGQPEEGLSGLAEGLSVAHKTGERWCEAEVYRLKGQLTLQKFHASGDAFQVPNLQHVSPSSEAEAE